MILLLKELQNIILKYETKVWKYEGIPILINVLFYIWNNYKFEVFYQFIRSALSNIEEH